MNNKCPICGEDLIKRNCTEKEYKESDEDIKKITECPLCPSHFYEEEYYQGDY